MNGMIGLLMATGVMVATTPFASPVAAQTAPGPQVADPKAALREGAGSTGADTNASIENSLQQVVSALLFLIGAISVIVIIIAGIMFTVSAGDPGRAKKAKDAILYAVVGLIVALLGYAIVAFVVQNIN